MARQAKCDTCRVRFSWLFDYTLKDAWCPVCGSKLQRSNIMSTLPESNRAPIGRMAAVRLRSSLATTPTEEGK